MDGQIEECDVKTILCSKTTSNETEDFRDDKVLCESTIITDNANLENHVKLEKIEEFEISTTFDNIETKMPLSEWQNNMINDNVNLEKGITVDDTKIEFDNGLLFCEHCRVYYRDYCTECGMLLHILNKYAPDKTDNATRSGLPDNVLEIREFFGQFGIFALRVIPKDIQFGPFIGLSTTGNNWKLKGGKFIDSEDKLKCFNWMEHINPARNICQKNLLAFQREGSLYYRSTREIHEGEELLVYFGEEYEESLNNNIEMDFSPIAEQDVKDVFVCTFCCLGYSSRSYLTTHKSICLDNADGKFSIEEFTQCPFCNFYMGVREYYECHMAFCSEQNVRKSILLKPNNHPIEVKTSRTRRLQMYKCSHCKYKTSYKGDLKSHVNQHYGVKQYKCGICCNRFKTRKYLKMHVENVHIGIERKQTQKYFRSDTSEHKGTKKTPLLKEFSLVSSALDYNCGAAYKKIGLVKKHIKTKKQLKQFRYHCGVCHYKTNYRLYLEKHIKTKHLKEFDYNCETCDFKTNDRSYLEKHIKTTHLKEFDYNCEICNFKTNARSRLEKHIKTNHLKEFDYSCEICDYKTNRRSHFEIHEKTQHLKEYDYNCKICDYKTNDRSYLEKHIKTKHLKEFDYNCETCNFKTNTRPHLEKHVKTEHLKNFDYNCEICDFKTNHRTQFENHIKTKHLKEFDYNCEICDYKTNRKYHLEIHKKAKHLNKYDYNCEKCDFKTNDRSYLEKHRKTKHLKEFDYNCELCDFKTNFRSYLERHRKTKHLKEFDYKCDLCQYETNRPSYLENHIKIKHLKEFDHKCGSCDYKAYKRSDLEKHIKTKHLKEYDYNCEICDFKTNYTSYLQKHIKSKHLKEFDYNCEVCIFKTNNRSHLEKHMRTKHLGRVGL